MNHLLEDHQDCVLHMASWLSLSEVHALSLTCQAAAHTFYKSTAADMWFLRRFHDRFGEPHTRGWSDPLGGRILWTHVYQIRQAAAMYCTNGDAAANRFTEEQHQLQHEQQIREKTHFFPTRNSNTTSANAAGAVTSLTTPMATSPTTTTANLTGLHTLGFLSPTQEARTLELDFPDWPIADIDAWRRDIPDYYGFCNLQLAGAIMVWGGFDGIRVMKNIHDFIALSQTNTIPTMSSTTPLSTACARISIQSILNHSNWHLTAGCWGPMDPASSAVLTQQYMIYLGFSTGDMVALAFCQQQQGPNDGHHQEPVQFQQRSHCKAASYVKSMDLTDKLHGNGCILSAHEDGTVWLYPHLQHSFSSFDNGVKIATFPQRIERMHVLYSDENSFWSVVRRIDQRYENQSIDLMYYHNTGAPEDTASRNIQVFPIKLRDMGVEEDFITAFTLVGHVPEAWRSEMECLTTLPKDAQLIVVATAFRHSLTFLTWSKLLPHTLQKVFVSKQPVSYSSHVASIERHGDLLILSMGSKGKVAIYDLIQRKEITSIQVHPGRKAFQNTTLRELQQPQRHHFQQQQQQQQEPAVICSEVCHERKSIVSLCRDGHVHEWSFGQYITAKL